MDLNTLREAAIEATARALDARLVTSRATTATNGKTSTAGNSRRSNSGTASI